MRARLGVVGRITAESVAWRGQGRLHVTVVAKATFRLVSGGPMSVDAPLPVERADVHDLGNPMRSVRTPSDLALYLGRADVTMVGHACAPAGRPVPVLPVRLAVLGARPLVDRTLHMYGDRGGAGPRPFDRLPLVWERAFGGISSPANPLGVGLKGKAPVEPPIHNLVDPADPRRTAGFGPIPATFPERRRAFGQLSRAALEAPIVEVPDGLDVTCFQCAPPDQRCEFLRGDEWVVLDGVHPTMPRIASQLPGARALLRADGLQSGGPADVPMVADMLHVDADALRCTVTWRGVVPVADPALLGALRLTAALSLPGEAMVWPAPEDDDDDGELARTAVLGAPKAARVEGGTVDLRDLAAHGPRGPVLPFEDDDDGVAMTVGLSGEALAAAARPALPFQPGSPWAAMPLAPAADVDDDEGSLAGGTVDARDLGARPGGGALPFLVAQRLAPLPPPLPLPRSSLPAPVAPLPPLPAPPRPPPSVPAAVAPPAPPAPPAPVAERRADAVPIAAAPKKAPAAPPRVPAPPPRAPAPPPPPPPVQPAASPQLKKGLYGKFGGDR